MDRREFLILTGAELLFPIYLWRTNPEPWIAARQRGRHVGQALLDELPTLVAARRRMDDEHGGAALLDALHADYRFVTDLIKNGSYSKDAGRGLYGIAAEIARIAGWVAEDSGRHASAQSYYLASLRATAAVGDRALGVNVIGLLGGQARKAGRPDDATRLMDMAAAESARTSEAVHAMTWARVGRVYAKAGDKGTSHAALDRASKLLGRAVAGDSPPWAYWVDETRMTEQLGGALFDLGDYEGAERELLAAVAGLGEQYPRDRAVCLARVATAQLRRSQVDEGCATAQRVVDLLADHVDTERGEHLLRTFRAEPAARGPSATSRDFTEYATARLGAK